MWLILLLLLAFDSVFLTLVKGPFNAQIRGIQGTDIKVNLTGVIIVYLALAFGLKYFIIDARKNSWDAFLLGTVIYAVYEFTNLALFTKWSVPLALLDTVWGGILFASTTFAFNQLKSII